MIIRAPICLLKREGESKRVEVIGNTTNMYVFFSYSSTRVLSLGLLPGTMHHAPWTDPVCVDYGDDPSPLHAFDHLIGIQYRDRLSFLPEPQMKPVR